MEKRDFIVFIAPYAMEDMKKNGVLASITIAQGILETSTAQVVLPSSSEMHILLSNR